MIKIKVDKSPEGYNIKLTNGVEFDYNSLVIGTPSNKFKNRYNKNIFLLIGSLNVENESLGTGVHFLMQNVDSEIYMIKKESFEANFQQIDKV